MTPAAEAARRDAPRMPMEPVARALRREVHALSERPDLLWQQLHNRLQWDDDPVPAALAPELARRSAPGAGPWLRTRTPPHESETLVATLRGDGDSGLGATRRGSGFFTSANSVNACAFSPDGAIVASAGDDGTIKLWEVASGRVRATLAGDRASVSVCAFSPDGLLLAADRSDGLSLWEVASRSERATLAGYEGVLGACAFSSDGRLLATAGNDQTARLWEVATGRKLATVAGNGLVSTCALSPDGTLLAFGCGDARVRSAPTAGSSPPRAMERARQGL